MRGCQRSPTPRYNTLWRDLVLLRSRFLHYVDRTADAPCWVWVGSQTSSGPVLHLGDRTITAARVSYALAHGSIDPTAHVIRTCRRRGCVNPDHLQALGAMDYGSHLRADPRNPCGRQTSHCLRGHPADEYVTRRDGRRACRACDRIRSRTTATRRRMARMA